MKQEALKELQEAVAILSYTINDLTHAGEDIENALKHLRAAVFMETPTPSMKFNIYDFTDDAEGTRPVMGCVHYQGGFKVASDAHVLVAVKSDYPDGLEGKNIDRKGEEYKDSKYPKWEALFSPKQNEAEGYRIDFDKLAVWKKEHNAEKKLKGKWGVRKAFVKVGPAFFSLQSLVTFAKFMKAEGTDTLRITDYRRAAACYAENGSKGLIMPSCIDQTRIDPESTIIWEAA